MSNRRKKILQLALRTFSEKCKYLFYAFHIKFSEKCKYLFYAFHIKTNKQSNIVIVVGELAESDTLDEDSIGFPDPYESSDSIEDTTYVPERNKSPIDRFGTSLLDEENNNALYQDVEFYEE
ncbi:hypothetical protein QE152_g3950 [Popillia japonica]|uniref:Uncharacterized protein n=1 Tax=Popillia japonica TaxID=7064 RepID=A0AAW1N2X1_POPJA